MYIHWTCACLHYQVMYLPLCINCACALFMCMTLFVCMFTMRSWRQDHIVCMSWRFLQFFTRVSKEGPSLPFVFFSAYLFSCSLLFHLICNVFFFNFRCFILCGRPCECNQQHNRTDAATLVTVWFSRAGRKRETDIYMTYTYMTLHLFIFLIMILSGWLNIINKIIIVMLFVVLRLKVLTSHLNPVHFNALLAKKICLLGHNKNNH